jgi:DNA-binding MarR family transcriptional regulator
VRQRLASQDALKRALCPDDRRAIYSEVTPAGVKLLDKARPEYNAILREALAEASLNPEMAHLVAAIGVAEAPTAAAS